jgi:hypothetical protein
MKNVLDLVDKDIRERATIRRSLVLLTAEDSISVIKIA